MHHSGHTETNLILPMEDQDKAVLMETVRHLAPHRTELMERWREAFASSVARPPTMSDEMVSEMAREMIDVLIELPREGRFDACFEALRQLGRKYVRLGVSYNSLVFAIHLYEESNFPVIARVFRSVDRLQEAIIAQDHLLHNVLALFAGAYYEKTLDELQSRTRQLEMRTAELEEEERKRQEFIAMVAHEFRNALTVLAGFVHLQQEVAAKGGVCNPHVLETIRSQARRLERLSNDLADVSHLDSGQFEMSPAKCDLIAVARETLNEHRVTTDSHSLVLEASAEEIIGEWDGERIAQAIANLVSNAIKYSPDGGRVKMSISRDEEEAVVSISDEGLGIAAREIPHLFEPFSRLYRQRKIKGTGLGLYITRGIVHAHGGRVWVESEEGKGSRFHIALPLRQTKGKIPRGFNPAA